jgi:DNA uptake protein ComE-like DNA-binding protein
MADMLTTDPFFFLSNQIAGTREKVADSIFENYKLQVAQTNDINNRAMQVALHDATALADLKQAVADGTLQTMLAASRTDAAIGATSAANQRLVMEQAEATRRLIVDLNTQNLNTALINTNTALTGLNGLYGGLGLAYGGAVAAYQSANQVNAVNALGSALASNGIINTGTLTGTTQTATPTTIR